MECTLALCQLPVSADKAADLAAAAAAVRDAAARGADLVVLPEMFNCPYDNACFPRYAEPCYGESWQALSAAARQAGVWLVGGSVPEREDGRLYNTCYVFAPDGTMRARHRKVHLFDIDVPGGQRFLESETLTAGDAITVVETPFGKLGVAICFDMRFAEFFRAMGDLGARIVAIPAAFNRTTGPAHWSLTLRMRAVDQQCFVAACSPARDESAGYVAYGHSLVADPWGRVLEELDEGPGMALVRLDLDQIDAIRQQIPILTGRRHDLYETVRR